MVTVAAVKIIATAGVSAVVSGVVVAAFLERRMRRGSIYAAGYRAGWDDRGAGHG